MVHVVFDPSHVHYDDFFMQTGGGGGALGAAGGDPSALMDSLLDQHSHAYFRGGPPYQRGYGGGGRMVVQRGAGIGSVFQGLWRFFLPVIRRVGISAAKEALNTGQRVMDKVVGEGAPFGKTVTTEAKRGLDNIIGQYGGGGGGIKRQRVTDSSIKGYNLIDNTIIKKKRSSRKPKYPGKKLKRDTFGYYKL